MPLSDKGLNYTEWLRLLNVSNDSSLARALTASDKATTSPLLSFLEAVVKSCGQGVESAAIQTEAVTLQDKLNMLDEKYADLPADHFLSEQDKQLQKINIENKQIQDIVKLEVCIKAKAFKILYSNCRCDHYNSSSSVLPLRQHRDPNTCTQILNSIKIFLFIYLIDYFSLTTLPCVLPYELILSLVTGGTL